MDNDDLDFDIFAGVEDMLSEDEQNELFADDE